MNKSDQGQEAINLLQEVLEHFEEHFDERYLEAGPEESEFLIGFNRRFLPRMKVLTPRAANVFAPEDGPDPEDVLLGMLREKSEQRKKERTNARGRYASRAA